jgi:hypothetical protein
MTIAELLALPVGQRVWWELHEVGGWVVDRAEGGPRIVWDDGQDTTVDPGDDDLAEFADTLERAGGPDADAPVVIDRPG